MTLGRILPAWPASQEPWRTIGDGGGGGGSGNDGWRVKREKQRQNLDTPLNAALAQSVNE